MKIIIVGAGMGGTSAGIALARIGHEVTIYEQVREIRPVGAAISLWSNGVKCLNYLGLGREIARLGGDMRSMSYVDGLTGETMTRFSLQPLVAQVGQRPYPVARADLQLMLMERFGLDDIRLGMRVVGVSDDGQQVTAHFADGSTATADLLIGADGAHSVVRGHVLGRTVERRYAGYVNWNGLVPVSDEVGPATQWTLYVGEGKRASVMPVAGGRFYFFLDVPLPVGLPNDSTQYKAQLHDYFKDWAAPVHTLIDSIDPQATNRVEIHDIEPFPTFARGRVALLGDAGHNTTPDIGQGGCAAMEDAVVLAMTLQTHTLGIEDALERYQAKRAERTAELVLRARKRSDVTHAKDPALTQAWYDELRQEDGSGILAGIARNIVGGPFG